jgi:3-oxoadipate enol-lactonase
MKVQANDISVNYELSGSGKYFTLVHGAGDNLNVWYNQVSSFSKHYRVLTYDVRGHGETEFPEGELSIDIWVSDLSALLKNLHIDETILLGHSLGGAIAIAFTVAHPDRVNALILSNCGGGAPRSKEKMCERAMRLKAQKDTLEKEGIEAFVHQRITGLFSAGFTERNIDTVSRYKQILSQTDMRGHVCIIRDMLKPAESSDLSKITCPTLMIEGQYDSFTNSGTAEAAQRAIKGSQLKIFPTGHATALEQPEAYNQAILKFLSDAGL